MFQDIIERARTRQFHTLVQDRLLDRVAADAGCASGIGRMSVLSDETMDEMVTHVSVERNSILADFGCGRGFVGQFLRKRGYAGRYVGVDRILAALDAARRNVEDGEFEEADIREYNGERKFDAILALEVTRAGRLDEALVQSMASALREGGRFAITIASLNGNLVPRLDDALALCEHNFKSARVKNTSAESTEFANGFYRAILAIDEWEPFVKQSLHAEAQRVLLAIDEGRFEYAIVTGVA